MRYTIICILSIVFITAYAQQPKIDSLLTLLKSDKEDTNKVNHLNAIAFVLYYTNPDSTIYLANQALDLSIKLNFLKGQTNSYNNTGNGYFQKADYPKALEYHLLALKIDEKLGNAVGVATRLSNIGNIYLMQGDYDHALDYYLRALNIAEDLKDRYKTAALLINIGSVYSYKKNYPKALDYYFRGLKIAEEFNYKIWQANALRGIGLVYDYQKSYSKALEYYSNVLGIYEELHDDNDIAAILGGIGAIYIEQKKYKEAYSYLYRALHLSDSIGAMIYVQENYNDLSRLYEMSTLPLPDSVGGRSLNVEQMRLRALYYHKRYIAVRDTLFSEENKKQLVRKEMNFEFEKKEAASKAEHDKEMAVAEADKKRQTFVTWSVTGGLLLVIVFAGFIFRSLRITRKQNIVIEAQKREVEQQKKLVEEHQKEIIDSITYAKRLQEAILPPLEYVHKHLPESFILYKPKDIVAGDFYWMEVLDNIIFIAAADCTGHGVPGAMVSVVCSNALNRTVKEFGLRDTGKILDKVTELVLETFEKSDKDVKDGMDISLLAIHRATGQVYWSGANNALWYIPNNEVVEITANKQPIGKHDNRKPFTSHVVELPSGSGIFYLFTDGFADQFGGPKGKKFKYKQMEEKLLAVSNMPMKAQKDILDKSFEEWKGKLEQVDDVLIIGIRI